MLLTTQRFPKGEGEVRRGQEKGEEEGWARKVAIPGQGRAKLGETTPPVPTTPLQRQPSPGMVREPMSDQILEARYAQILPQVKIRGDTTCSCNCAVEAHGFTGNKA